MRDDARFNSSLKTPELRLPTRCMQSRIGKSGLQANAARSRTSRPGSPTVTRARSTSYRKRAHESKPTHHRKNHSGNAPQNHRIRGAHHAQSNERRNSMVQRVRKLLHRSRGLQRHTRGRSPILAKMGASHKIPIRSGHRFLTRRSGIRNGTRRICAFHKRKHHGAPRRQSMRPRLCSHNDNGPFTYAPLASLTNAKAIHATTHSWTKCRRTRRYSVSCAAVSRTT